MKNNKKTVLITGAARGIGAACAEKFAALGYNIVLNYRTSEKQALALAETLGENGAEVLCVCADVSDANAVESLFAQAEATFGNVDILINNAGISQIKMLCDVTEADLDDYEGTLICASKLRWRAIENHMGEKLFYHSDVEDQSEPSREPRNLRRS